MPTFILMRWHARQYGSPDILRIGEESAGAVVERLQRQRRLAGLPDAVTWTTHVGSLASALVASTRL